MADFITLSCPTCGGRLNITEDVERFACAHCGNEHLVQRTGGIVYVKELVDDVKSAVEKNTAEVALPRLQREIEQLKARISDIDSDIYCLEMDAGEEQERSVENRVMKGVSETLNNTSAGQCSCLLFGLLFGGGAVISFLGIQSDKSKGWVVLILAIAAVAFLIWVNMPEHKTEAQVRTKQTHLREQVNKLRQEQDELKKVLNDKQKQLEEYRKLTG